MRERFLQATRGEPTDRPPVWMMRQAGRYLPEYRAIREDHTFREAISNPEIATEISLQPWRRFEPDAVVMYSDILTVLEPLSFQYHIEPGVGPVIDNPVESPADTARPVDSVDESLDYVATLIENLTDELGEAAATLGFCGGPFTLAAYACEGRPSRSFMAIRRLRYEHPDAFQRLLRTFTDVLLEYLELQQAAGADAIQIFDTYAGLLDREDYERFLVPLHQELVATLDVPSILFVRNMPDSLELLAASEADVIGLDWTVDLAEARSTLGDRPVQGNLDPAVLYADSDEIRERTRAVLEAGGGRGHILNLGHGIDQHTPIEGVETFFEAAKLSEER